MEEPIFNKSNKKEAIGPLYENVANFLAYGILRKK